VHDIYPFLFLFYLCTIPIRKVYNQKYKPVLPILRAIEFLKIQKHPRPSNLVIVKLLDRGLYTTQWPLKQVYYYCLKHSRTYSRYEKYK
jgi:hypothetical protein